MEQRGSSITTPNNEIDWIDSLLGVTLCKLTIAPETALITSANRTSCYQAATPTQCNHHDCLRSLGCMSLRRLRGFVLTVLHLADLRMCKAARDQSSITWPRTSNLPTSFEDGSVLIWVLNKQQSAVYLNETVVVRKSMPRQSPQLAGLRVLLT